MPRSTSISLGSRFANTLRLCQTVTPPIGHAVPTLSSSSVSWLVSSVSVPSSFTVTTDGSADEKRSRSVYPNQPAYTAPCVRSAYSNSALESFSRTVVSCVPLVTWLSVEGTPVHTSSAAPPLRTLACTLRLAEVVSTNADTPLPGANVPRTGTGPPLSPMPWKSGPLTCPST